MWMTGTWPALADVDTPAVILNWATVRANVERMAKLARSRDVALRPHIKTHKMVELAQLQITNGAVGVTVAKVGEAEVMVAGGIRDVLVDYPVVGPQKVKRLFDLTEHARISVAIDSVEVGRGLSAEAVRRSTSLPVLIEVDTGLRRCGVLPHQPTLAAARAVDALPGLDVIGILTHEGHAYTSGALATSTHVAAEAMAETADLLIRAGLPVAVVSMGSSGTAATGIGLPHITEFRPGTYVFNDRTQVALGAARLEDCAAVVVATVVGRTTSGEILLDAGSKALTSDRMVVVDPPLTYGQVLGRPEWNVVRLSEEHGILDGPGTGELAIGDRLSILPNHICPILNLFDSVTVVDGSDTCVRLVDARGKSQ